MRRHMRVLRMDSAQELQVLMPGAGHRHQEPEPIAAVDRHQGVPELHIHLHISTG